jgi:hypothetical protein
MGDTQTTQGTTRADEARRDVRARLLIAITALAVIQFVHLVDVLRYAEGATFPQVLFDPLAAVGIGLAAGAATMLALRRPSARMWSIAASAAVAVGFLLHHGIPVDLGTNNPYFTLDDGNRADLFRWATVVALIALGAWTARTAWRADAELV